MTVLFCTFAALAIILTVTTFVLRESMLIVLGMASTFAWMVFSAVSYSIAFTTGTGANDPYFFAFIFGIALVITVPVATFELWAKARKYSDYADEREEYEHQERLTPKETMNSIDRIRLKHGLGLSAARQRRELNRKTGWE